MHTYVIRIVLIKSLRICVLAGISTLVFLMNQPRVFAATTYPKGLTISQSGTYENLDVSNPGGFCVKITAPNVILRNSKIHDCNGFGIWVESTHDVQILGNEVWNTVLNTCYPSCSGGWDSALKVRSANQTDKLAYNIVFEGNIVHGNLGEGIASRGSNVTIRKNTFYDNFSVNIYTNGDHTTIENNFVYCTGESRYQRDGSRPAGIAQGDESYTGWNPSHANNLKVVNNIVSGCKYGFRYLGAEPGVEQAGLKDSTIAHNTFACTTNASISIPYEASQNNLTVHNNIGGTTLSSIENMSGVSSVGNITKTFACNSFTVNTFRLTSALPATGTYKPIYDFVGTLRDASPDTGALEYTSGSQEQPTATPILTSSPVPSKTNTPTPASFFASDLNTDGQVNIFDYNILLSNFDKRGAPGFIPSDIIQNGVVDIFDYNKLISEFKN